MLLIEFDIQYVSQKPIKKSIVANHLASLLIFDGRVVDNDFLDDEIITMTSLSSWHMYFAGATNHFGYRIGVLLVSFLVITFRGLFIWCFLINIRPRTILLSMRLVWFRDHTRAWD